ncbi:MAG TPA: DUF3810 domain-containing protein [Firmicutes bacterium]|nr:DUF3810 domain-containing protein [Bacillota bacterium]
MSKKFLFLLFIPLSYIISFCLSHYPSVIENYYSNTFNNTIIKLLSRLTNCVPFSVFELMVIASFLGLLIYLVYTLFLTLTKPNKRRRLTNLLANLSMIGSILYALFVLLWGLNYNRISFYESANIPILQYSTTELANLYAYLVQQCNDLKLKTSSNSEGVFDYPGSVSDLFKAAPAGYTEAAKMYPTLSGTYGLPKPIFFSELLNYTMITGVYSPFTGEANVNVNVPEVTLVFTTMHEMAHQRGYASEDEANFIAFMTCITHNDPHFQYAGYLSALGYVNHALAKYDRETLIELNQNLSDEVIIDMRYKSDFWKNYEGPVESMASHVNNTYLQLNGVTDGVHSYGRMVDGLLGYYETTLNNQ